MTKPNSGAKLRRCMGYCGFSVVAGIADAAAGLTRRPATCF